MSAGDAASPSDRSVKPLSVLVICKPVMPFTDLVSAWVASIFDRGLLPMRLRAVAGVEGRIRLLQRSEFSTAARQPEEVGCLKTSGEREPLRGVFRSPLSSLLRAFRIDPLFDVIAKVADQALHGPSNRIPEGANGAALDLRGDVE
jgi:hypothetical protein